MKIIKFNHPLINVIKSDLRQNNLTDKREILRFIRNKYPDFINECNIVIK